MDTTPRFNSSNYRTYGERADSRYLGKVRSFVVHKAPRP